MKILITGGAGYIGSTIASALIDASHQPILIDNLVNGRREFTKNRIFYEGDIGDSALIARIFDEQRNIDAVIHCAALIIVPDSVARPYDYYHENVTKSLNLFHQLAGLGVRRIVFSSSASVYDTVPGFMVTEEAALKPLSPYSRTKLMMEMMLEDLSRAEGFSAIALRYFNPIGADPAMRTGPYLKKPSHVLAKIIQAADGQIPYFAITGTDWPTRDGTGIRDYMHVWDLARAHVAAVERFDQCMDEENRPFAVINLGTGNGVTVRELLAAFESVAGKPVASKEEKPRPGDVAGAFANCDKAKKRLLWSADKTVADAIKDALSWDKARKHILNGFLI